MTQEEIKAIFDKVFYGLKNPIFTCVQDYFEKDNFLFEVATPRHYIDSKLAKTSYRYFDPIMLFDILFTDACIKGYWVTVLERIGDKYVHRTDLCKHIDTYDKDNIESIINDILYGCNNTNTTQTS